MRKNLYGISAFVLAFGILSVSVLRSSSVAPAYGYSAPVNSPVPSPTPIPDIDYLIPYPGKILPDNALWYAKVVRDRMQYYFAGDILKKADLALLYSDKRLAASKNLFEKSKPDLATTVLTKGEKYLEIAVRDEELARKAGVDTGDFLIKIATASLKHQEVIKEEILPMAPEDLKPVVVKAADYAKNTYKNSRDVLNSLGKEAPKDPINWQ